MTVGARDERALALCGIGLPVAMRDRPLDAIQQCAKPKLFVQGALDQYGPAELMAAWFSAAMEPKRLVSIPGADHFLTGHTDELREAIEGYFGSGLTLTGD